MAEDASQTMALGDRFAEMGEKFQDFGRKTKANVRKVETMTRNRPKTALGMAFVAGLATAGLAFAAWSLTSSNRKDRRTPEA